MQNPTTYKVENHVPLNGELPAIKNALEQGGVVNSGRIENTFEGADESDPVQLTVYGKECWFLNPEYYNEVAQAIVDYQNGITPDLSQTGVLYEATPYLIVHSCLQHIESILAVRYHKDRQMTISSGNPDRIALLLRYFYGRYDKNTVEVRSKTGIGMNFVNELPISVFDIHELIEKAGSGGLELERKIAAFKAGQYEYSLTKCSLVHDKVVQRVIYRLVRHRDISEQPIKDAVLLLEEIDLSSLREKQVRSGRLNEVNIFGAPKLAIKITELSDAQQMIFEALIDELIKADEQEY